MSSYDEYPTQDVDWGPDDPEPETQPAILNLGNFYMEIFSDGSARVEVRHMAMAKPVMEQLMTTLERIDVDVLLEFILEAKGIRRYQ